MNSKHGEIKTIYSNSHESKGLHNKIVLTDDNKLMRIEQVEQITGLNRCTIYRYIKEGAFPKQKKLGVRNIVFVRAEIEKWIDDVINS